MEDLLFKALNESISEADAEFKFGVKGSDCKINWRGNLSGMLVAFVAFTETVNEEMIKRGATKKTAKILLESAFETGMEATDE